MKPAVVFTGASGFIGRRILKALNDLGFSQDIVCLTEGRFVSAVRESFRDYPHLNVIESDITKPQLGLSSDVASDLRKRAVGCFHLAAFYNLSVPKEIAQKVNVEGTEHVIEFLNTCERPVDLLYFSTCYVAGNSPGVFSEDDLEKGQSFKNHYEETKFEAEKVIRKWMGAGGKGIIVRPGIVCGDSKTGETEKFDGLYFVMQVIDGFRFLPFPLPKPGSLKSPSNLVPVDFLVDVTVRLWEKRQEYYGRTFQVTDPSPLTSEEVFDLLCREILGKPAGGRIPPWMLRGLFQILSIRKSVPKEILDYFDHQSEFDCSNLETFLERENLKFPNMRETMPVLHRYWGENHSRRPDLNRRPNHYE